MWFLLKKIPASWVIISLLGLAVWILWGMLQRERTERVRLSGNQELLFDRVNRIMETYRVRDSLHAARVDAMNLTVTELRDHFPELSKMVRDMDVKLSRLQSLSSIATVQKYEVHTTLRDSVVLRDSQPQQAKTIDYHSRWFDIKGTFVGNDAILFPRSRDSIIQAIDRIPKKFLFFRVGTKGIRQTVVSGNPDSEITYNEILMFR